MDKLFKPSKNCHQVVTARQAAFIVDGEAYFRALYETFCQAEHTIFIVGWDLHSDVQLLREGDGDGCPVKLGELLDKLVSEKKTLHVYLLVWDFAMIYALEREFFPRYKLEWQTHRRIHFRLDGHHPIGASQHQKIVTVDDAVGFVGGLDVSQWRWDTRAHERHNQNRVDPEGKPYPPFHDVQLAVQGPAARALGQLARDRWKKAGGATPGEQDGADADFPWPGSIEADFGSVQVAVARTLPAYGDQESVREVKQLYLDSIAAARRFIYIENQYLSSHLVGQALKRRLQEQSGPEVVMVLPERTGGWLERHTMDVLRSRILKELQEADRYDRLQVFYPRISEDPHCSVMVHAKIMVIDDDFVRVGSSNLSNRSMGLDSECDLAISAGTDKTLRPVIARFRNRLLAEHLGTSSDDIGGAVEKTGSLIKAVASHRHGRRTLVPLSFDVSPEVERWVPESELLDPEKPVAPDELFDHFISPDQQPTAYRHMVKIAFLVTGFSALAVLWRWTPLGEWADMASAKALIEWLLRQPLTPVLVPAVYVLGGMVAFPLTLMIIATAFVFGPWWGLFYALIGSELSALVIFGAGRFLGREAIRRFAGSLLNRLSQKLSENGLMAVIAFRIIPVAPFSVINLVAGVSEIRLRDFALGSLIGMLPGAIAVIFLADRVWAFLSRPDIYSIALLGGTVVVVAAGLAILRRWMKRKRTADDH